MSARDSAEITQAMLAFAEDLKLLLSRVTRFTLSGVPEGDAARKAFAITVEYCGRGTWAIRQDGLCLSRSGNWDYEPMNSSRTERWLKAHRFNLNEALGVAEHWVPKVVVNGMTAAQYLERRGGAA